METDTVEMTEEELKKNLKYCVVKNDKQKLKEILRGTISMRRQMFERNDEDMIEFWHFYFVDTEMVRSISHSVQKNIFNSDLYIRFHLISTSFSSTLMDNRWKKNGTNYMTSHCVILKTLLISRNCQLVIQQRRI